MVLTKELIAECTNEYHKSIDRLSKLVIIVVEKLEKELAEHKIMARVSGRVKGRESLYKKLIKWSEDESKSKLFTNKHDVFSCV